AEQALADHEQRQAALEADEARSTSALLEHEAGHSRAALEAQRAHDRLDNAYERAAADGIELPDDAGAADNADTGDELQSKIGNLKSKIERLGGVNPLALEEYEEAAERHAFLAGQIADIRQAQDSLRALIGELDAAVHERFAATFAAVASEFEQSFTRLFGGGAAQLQLVGAQSAANGTEQGDLDAGGAESNGKRAGVEIMARPPGKRMQNLSLLSGGERTLTAAALLFAILKVNPSPFCIMDEVDAALDESNVGRFREALLDLSHQTQFILITHNRGTIEAADTLYGISMGDDGGSRALSLKLAELVENVE
ncbi:MAG: AAA family ATPase, partial [Chloroflexales bacterium]|nr:AAA family ATPase [Chloroflexales bacterium]